MNLTSILEYVKYTKKSIFPVSLFCFVASFYIAFTYGFEDKKTISILAISFIGVFLISYITGVFISYYRLPKKKDPNKYGVLFVIDTHNNKEDYEAIKNKICEHFDTLSEQSNTIKLVSITPTLKNISCIKNIDDFEKQKKLLKKTNCFFGVFMKATDFGKGNSKYELQMNAMVSHVHLEPNLKQLLAKNFGFVFRNLKLNSIDKTNDLKDLQLISTKLYIICQLIYGVCYEYAGYYLYAIRHYNSLLKNISKGSGSFYKEISSIINFEICAAVTNFSICEYHSYVYQDEYDFELVKETLEIMQPAQKVIHIDGFTMDFHLSKAIFLLLSGKIMEAKGEINLLSNKFKKYPPNKQSWLFSEACLVACEDNPKTYTAIESCYKKLAFNTAQDPKTMFDFLHTYSVNNPNNLGVKIAMFFIVMYRPELPIEILPKTLKTDLLRNCKKLKMNELYQLIKEAKKSF